jgi:hypothetical protein
LSFPQEFNYFKFVFELVVGDRAHEVLEWWLDLKDWEG